MKVNSFSNLLSCLLVMSLAAGCSDDTFAGDGGSKNLDAKVVPDQISSNLPDGYGPLYDCTKVGKACNAHDPCAINPICGPDKKCRPSFLQDCSDSLDCTVDTCLGQGLCSNEPKTGTCALPVKTGGSSDSGAAADAGSGPDATPFVTVMKCFKKDERNPSDTCMICKPSDGDSGGGNSKAWSPANGGSCDDKNLCTKDDYCQSGVCKGSYFGNLCADGYGCTTDLCDGKGGCLGNKLKPDYCLISKVCYKKNASHPQGSCFTCDPSKSTTAWTPITNTCMINSKCYNKGAKNPAGCGECDPAVSTTKWTVKGTTCCWISSKAYTAGTKDPTGCSTCDPTKDKYGWTPLSNLCLISGKCYTKGAKNPGGCGECVPATSGTAWTVTGTTCCLISNKSYTAGTKDPTGCTACVPTKNKYGWTALTNICTVGSKCYDKGAKHAQGCAECDPAMNAAGWTVKVNTHCLIKDKCYTKGTNDPSKCSSCDPTKTKYDWTPFTGKCMIDGTCHAKGAKHPQGCAECKPTSQPNNWTVTDPKYCIANYKCFLLCSGKCYNLDTDINNCGTCGNKCTGKLICKAGKCVAPCTIFEGFETWPNTSLWNKGLGTKTSTYKHDGTYSLKDPEWIYETKITVGKKGEKLSVWVFPTSSGRTYMGFLAKSSGAWSLVLAPNTKNIIIQQNSGWGYKDKATASVSYTYKKWYKLEVEFLDGISKIKGTLYNSDGKTVIKSIPSYDLSTPSAPITTTVGGIAIRGFGGMYIDSYTICQ